MLSASRRPFSTRFLLEARKVGSSPGRARESAMGCHPGTEWHRVLPHTQGPKWHRAMARQPAGQRQSQAYSQAASYMATMFSRGISGSRCCEGAIVKPP
jgi:hypothetical protein